MYIFSYSVSQGITDTQICATIIMEDDHRYFKIPRPLEVWQNFTHSIEAFKMK